jgi:hypothetical protein
MSAEENFTEEMDAPCPEGSGVTIDDFVAYMPQHVYIFMPCREPWPAASVDARLPPMPVLDKNGKPKKDKNGKPLFIRATMWLDQNRPVECMTWAPGYPMLIKNRLVVDSGWIERKDVTTFNHYREPRIQPGNATKARPWLEHIYKVYPENAGHIIMWLAQRVQRPQEKINHALVLGGLQGIGKDTLLAPLKHAVGPWNFHDVDPIQLLAPFNPFLKSVILRVNEARDLGEFDRFKFYHHTKNLIAAPPETLYVNEKNLRQYYVFNVLGFVITTNHKTDGIHLPADDRRHYVTWSNLKKEDFTKDYFETLWDWYNNEDGHGHVAAYLAGLDISAFDPKAPPPKTPAFWEIVSVNQAPEDAELADVIDKLGSPDALTVKQLIAVAPGNTAEWLMDPKSRRSIPHRLERCGYTSVNNEEAKDGYWRVANTRQRIFAKQELPADARRAAVSRLVNT